MAPSLLSSLAEALSQQPGHHSYQLSRLRSQPRRAHALFPHATEVGVKVWQEEELVVLSEGPVTGGEGDSSKAVVPVVAIEAAFYTVPSTATTLIYISKIDTTGLLPSSSSSSSPTRALVRAYLKYYLVHPSRGSTRVRVHIFARSQGQYLFPGSVGNEGKRVATDKGLVRWWYRTLDGALDNVESKQKEDTIKAFYLVPAVEEREARAIVGSASSSLPPSSNNKPTRWTYGEPYSHLSIPSPLYSSSSSSSQDPGPRGINDLIPAFPDDPKSRFLHSLTSSPVPSAGEEGDYDTVFSSSSSLAQGKLEQARAEERRRLIDGVKGGAKEFWERMEWRQECCSGAVVGFFVVVADRPVTAAVAVAVGAGAGAAAAETTGAEGESQATNSSHTSNSNINNKLSMRPLPRSLPYSLYTKLWTQFHNTDYSSASLLPSSSSSEGQEGEGKLILSARKWRADLRTVCAAEGAEGEGGGGGQEGEVELKVEVRNEERKRPAEDLLDGQEGGKQHEVVNVNMMVPKKKKKKV